MEPLRLIIKMLTWLGAYPPGDNASRSKKLLYIFIAVVTIAVLVCCNIGFAAFFFKYIMSDLEKSLMAVMTLCSGFIPTYILLVSMFKRSNMRNIFDRLSEIYELSKNPFKILFFRMILWYNSVQFQIQMKSLLRYWCEPTTKANRFGEYILCASMFP